MAVGPLDPVASCVTGGTGVAKERDCGRARREAEPAPSDLGSFPREVLSAMVSRMARMDCFVKREEKET